MKYRGNGECVGKWSNPEYIYKEGLTEFGDGLNVNMKERKNDSKDFGFSNWLK